MQKIKLKKDSWLVKWYLLFKGDDKWSKSFGSGAYYYKDPIDICKFRRVCFITGPLLVFFLTVLGGGLFFGVVILPFIAIGWQAIFIWLLIAAVFIFAYLLSMGIVLVSKSSSADGVKQSWKSFKERWCAQIKFVD